uniref:ras-specific guanine nucleotide-releasing factor 2-like n=1 Tax=Myxine glutinosa TaxID=7769 RepID=UPI00358EC36F
MQRALRYNDLHVAALACRARRAGTRVRKHSADGSRWHGRWLALYQNLLFCFESESSVRPLAVYLLEGSACRRVGSPRLAPREPSGKHVYFTIDFDSDGQKVLEFQAENEVDCEAWVSAISQCSYADLQEDREALLHKLNHVLHIADAEKAANDQLRQQLEDSETEVARLKVEIAALNKTNKKIQQQPTSCPQDEDPDIRKIKKCNDVYVQVQSFMRGWLCRRKWKTIVQDYIHSPHAENMRKRNRIVFSMVEAEAEYTQQLHTLVAVFLRPLRMAASSKKPPISHDDVSSIFLNSETIMFLHQIFYQGLRARIANWPTLILADLFDILLPMLNIYQEFLRNHQYSLQVLASCKQNRDFDKLLKQYEAKTDCENRTLETFLTLPMFQIPRYIVTLHELLAHTPHEHVERKTLEFAKQQLEELSRVLHDEVSETENIRKSLAVERMIVEGCDVLLDSSQMFVRQGSLYQLPVAERGWASRSRMASLSLRREGERQCFLFTKHLLICTRSSGGKLHLIKTGGVLPLINCTLIEDTEICEDEGKVAMLEIEHLDFKLVVESRDEPPYTVILMATTLQEKAAWASDIGQCIDNIRCDELMMNVFEESSKVTVPQMVKSDSSLHSDSPEIRFSKKLNSCKIPHIRASSVDHLLERLADLRFLSIDFLNTFLHTYRVFMSSGRLLRKLTDIYRYPQLTIPPRALELFFVSNQSSRSATTDVSPTPCTQYKMPLTCTSSPAGCTETPASSPPDLSNLAHIPVSGSDPESQAPLDPDCSEIEASTCNEMSKQAISEAENNSTLGSSKRATKSHAPGNALLEMAAAGSTNSVESSPIRHPISPCHNRTRRSPEQSQLHWSSAGSSSPLLGGPLRHISTNWRPAPPPPSLISALGGQTLHQAEGQQNEDFLRWIFPAVVPLTATRSPPDHQVYDKEFVIRRAATNRVLNVLRHWVFKHSQDFERNQQLKNSVISFLEEVLKDPEILGQERKAVNNILRALAQDEKHEEHLTLDRVISLCSKTSPAALESLPSLELAEQLTLLDCLVFGSIPYEEFLGQSWMKPNKNDKTPCILKATKHFNEVSNLVVWEIVRQPDLVQRTAVIEKWVAVADICRCLHNYNGILEIASALNRSAVFRLKKTWARVSKQTKGMIEKLQKIVSSEGRFKNLREALKSCDALCVPYLGMYLTDLAMIEEGTSNFTPEGLVNFSKMRMIAHIIREIRQFQQYNFNIKLQPEICSYLLDQSVHMDDECLYALSLLHEPRLPT